MRKIKIRPTHIANSVCNMLFSIDKGQVVTVPDNFHVDLHVFDIVERDGKPVSLDTKISDKEALALLEIKNLSNFQEKVREMNLSEANLKRLLEFERAGKKRKDFMLYLHEIPIPKDEGIQITDRGLLVRELMAVKGIGDKLANHIVDTYKDRATILDKLTNNWHDIEQLKGMKHEIVVALKKHFKVEKSKVTTRKNMFGGK